MTADSPAREATLAVLGGVLPLGSVVRVLTPTDVDAYLDLTRRASDLYEDYDGGLPTRDALVADMLARPSGVPMEAKLTLGVFRGDDDTLVAYLDALTGYPDATTWFIGLLLVAESERGRGLGTALVEGLGLAASAHGAKRLMIGVLDANAPARRFWSGLGFRDERHVPDYVNAAGQPQPVTRMERPLLLA